MIPAVTRYRPSTNYAATILATSGLVSFWELADASGSSTAVDSGPNGVNGTVSGSVTFGVSGQSGKTACQFAGTTVGHIGVANNSGINTLTSGWSVEGWAYPTAANDGIAIFTEIFGSNVLLMNLSFDHSPDHAGTSNLPVVGFYNGNSGPGWESAFSSSTLTQNAWQYFIGTYDGSTLKMYTNATLVSSQSAANHLTTSHAGYVIGSRHDASVDFVGSLQYVAVYNVALSQATISAHYAAI